jgi:ribosomal protein S18 acetylase RimI-like enzyme
MVTTSIREAKESDVPAIGSLAAELIKTMDNSKGIDIHQALDNCKHLLQDPSSYLFVAELNKTIVGFITITLRKTLIHQGLSGLINELVVAEKYRGKGIGTQMIFATIERCKQLGCCEVEVSTEKTNRKAKNLYLSCGFEERGVLFEVDV